ncbi:hypothetical protein IV203_015136 [Nitzschia inconspicua]|uniref:Uncharacterized protein n=1 Tax=Nitzschia inconspicua TaxID=303405 RepID=A0A9K3LAL5_9STRA|nr:hypothetical protein IV203_015136 [Nitzschia inconspicua]
MNSHPSSFLSREVQSIHHHGLQRYTTSRVLRLAEGGESNKAPPSSYLDSIQSQTARWWNKVAESTSNVAKQAASKTLDTSRKLAQDAASKTQQVTQDAANQAARSVSKLSHSAKEAAKQQAAGLSKSTSESLSKATEAAKDSLQHQVSHISKATSDTLSKASQSVTQTARDSLKATQDTAQQAYHRNIQQPIQETAQNLAQSTEKMVDNLTNSGTKLLRYLAVWSLAAVFVYGMATTLPIQLIKYGMEKRQPTDESAGGTGNARTTESQEEVESNKAAITGRWW